MSYQVLMSFCTASILSAFINLNAQTNNSPEELGAVDWHRDFDKAVSMSKTSGKDILILFQEVPGCATCRNYGHNVLSHPLMVEAIENEFVPLAIFNNKGGKDKEVLKKFSEPSWNNPVVRIVNSKSNLVVPRIGNDYESLTLANSMIAALKKRNVAVPLYLELLRKELKAGSGRNIQEAYYGMYCFWSGEKELGKLDGILSTESGFMDGGEVVKIVFDKSKLTEKEIAQISNYQQVQKGSFRAATNDVHYYLQQTEFAYLPLTELQKTKINSALGNSKPVIQYLSPQQKIWLSMIKKDMPKFKKLGNTSFENAWENMCN